DERCGGAVDEEVVELDRRAHAAGDGDAPDTGPFLRGARVAGCGWIGTRTSHRSGDGGFGSPRGRHTGHVSPPLSVRTAGVIASADERNVVMPVTPAPPPKGG